MNAWRIKDTSKKTEIISKIIQFVSLSVTCTFQCQTKSLFGLGLGIFVN